MVVKPTYGQLDQRVQALEKEARECREAADVFKTIFDSVNDAIMIHDPNTGRPLDANPKMIELLGYSKNEITRMQVSDWSAGDPEWVQKEAVQKIKVAALGKPQLFEWHAQTKDNQRIWLEVNLKGTAIKGEDRVLAVVRDITERKKAERALRQSEQKFRDLVESTSDWVWEVDRKGVYTYCSPKVKEVIGYHPHEVVGKTPFDFMPSEEAKRVTDLFLKIAASQERFDALENTNLHKNGTPVVIETSGIPIFDADGLWTGYRGIDRDITERKIAESQREELEARLHHARKMESIGTLAGGVAHDFNNLLFMIIGNAELLLEDVPEYHQIYSSIKDIKDAGLRAAGIVKQLLRFSRKAVPKMETVNALKVIREALDFLRSTLPANIKFRLELPDDDLMILADPVQINQLMMNVCINAAQAMEKDGGFIDIQVGSVDLSDKLAVADMELAPGAYIKVTIGDTGPGIGSEHIERIFEPYFTTKGIGEGTGMGLAVAHGIVASHNGVITVKSEPGKGAAFTFLIPLVISTAQIEAPKKDHLTGGSETILFVDDEISIVKMVRRMLERLGYRVETHTNPLSALHWFRKNSNGIDLVITDMAMPDMTGDKLAVALMRFKPELPVILCTGFSNAMSNRAAKKIGIRSFVHKPLVKAELANTIRQVLDEALQKIAM